MKANLDDCMLIKIYHRELTDAAIRLIRKAHKIVLDFKDIWNLEDEDDSFLFTNPNNDHQSTVSFNHADQMQCNCPWYITERFVCPHMLVILEQRVLPDLQDENKDITDIIAMTSIFKKKQATEIIDHASQFTQFSQEPIVIQSTRPREVPDNQRYHKLYAVFQRFASRATQVSQNEFDKMLDSLTIITEMSEQNKTNLHNDLLHEKDNESFELPDINMAFNAADTEESIPSTSAAVANAPPFTISSCLRPVGRAKGGAQSSVSFHKKVTFKRVASTREFAKSSQPAKICKTSKPTKSTTTTKTKIQKRQLLLKQVSQLLLLLSMKAMMQLKMT